MKGRIIDAPDFTITSSRGVELDVWRVHRFPHQLSLFRVRRRDATHESGQHVRSLADLSICRRNEATSLDWWRRPVRKQVHLKEERAQTIS